MLGSMYSAVSGLSAHQTKMNVIGNNIANVNTYGFKSSRVTFSDVFYQTMNSATAPTTNAGGTNPTQLGYGAKVNSIDVINTRAGSATTDRALDVYINGDGYLPVKDGDGVIKYTRVGILSFDVSGNLVDSNGNMVLGIPMDTNTKMPQLDANGTVSAQQLVPIKVTPEDLDKYTGIAIGQNGEITAIKEGDPTIVPAANTSWIKGTPSITSTSIYNGDITLTAVRSSDVALLKGTYTGTTNTVNGVTVDKDADINGTLNVNIVGNVYTLKGTHKDGTEFNIVGTNTVDGLGNVTAVSFTVNSLADAVTMAVGADTNTEFVVPGDINVNPNVSLGSVVAETIDITGFTYNKAGQKVEFSAQWPGTDNNRLTFGDMVFTVDPAKFGSISNTTLNDTVIGNVGPGPGVPVKIANLAAVKFTNSDGLAQNGEGYYLETTNSGKPVGTIPGNGGTGSFRAGALEMSNVDLSREFTEMIITQRGFQANTRMITVSDEMLSELVSMKR